jgi:hypothetical protein
MGVWDRELVHRADAPSIVTVYERSGSHVPRGGALVVLPALIKHLLPQKYRRYVM